MKLRKLIAVFSAVLMLCALIPVGAMVSAADNLVANGDFEAGNFNTGWDQSWYAPSIVTDVVHSGSYAMKTGNTASQYQTMIKSADIAVEANTNYKVTFWYYYEGTAATPKFYFYAQTTSAGNIKSITLAPAASGNWYQGTLEFNSGSNTAITLLLQNCTVNSGGFYYFDDFAMKKVVEPSNDGYVYNGDFETGDTIKWNFKWSGASAEMVAGHNGGSAAKVIINSQWENMCQSIAVEANTDYVVTFWAKDCDGMTFLIKGSANITQVAPAGSEWAQYTLAFNSGDNTAINLMMMGSRTTTCTGIFDDIKMVKQCDTCASDANYPCYAGTCTVCGAPVAAAGHSYDNAYDADCYICGDIRGVELPVSFGGNSVSEDVSGLAFRFDMDIDNVAIAEGKKTKADFSAATIDGNKVIKIGAIATNGNDTIDIEVVHLCDLEPDSIGYAIRIINIPAANLGSDITITPYFIVEIDGETVTVYGEAQTANYNQYI